jgi:hypothetical protein
MQKEIRQTPKYKQIQNGFSDVEVFITEDGKEFKTEKEALNHEKELISWEIFCKKYSYFTIEMNGYTYDVIVINELTEYVKREIKLRWHNLHADRLKLGINLIHINDSGDYVFTTVYQPDEMIQNKEKEIEQLKEEINKLKELKVKK